MEAPLLESPGPRFAWSVEVSLQLELRVYEDLLPFSVCHGGNFCILALILPRTLRKILTNKCHFLISSFAEQTVTTDKKVS